MHSAAVAPFRAAMCPAVSWGLRATAPIPRLSRRRGRRGWSDSGESSLIHKSPVRAVRFLTGVRGSVSGKGAVDPHAWWAHVMNHSNVPEPRRTVDNDIRCLVQWRNSARVGERSAGRLYGESTRTGIFTRGGTAPEELKGTDNTGPFGRRGYWTASVPVSVFGARSRATCCGMCGRGGGISARAGDQPSSDPIFPPRRHTSLKVSTSRGYVAFAMTSDTGRVPRQRPASSTNPAGWLTARR